MSGKAADKTKYVIVPRATHERRRQVQKDAIAELAAQRYQLSQLTQIIDVQRTDLVRKQQLVEAARRVVAETLRDLEGRTQTLKRVLKQIGGTR